MLERAEVFGIVGAAHRIRTITRRTKLSEVRPRFPHHYGYNQVIGNPNAPILNALAQDYGLAPNYSGVADPSEPNYVAMLGGDFFGISDDDPYWFPGHTVNANNLMSQLEGAGKTWRGYFQSMPYPGYRGYCYPDKCTLVRGLG